MLSACLEDCREDSRSAGCLDELDGLLTSSVGEEHRLAAQNFANPRGEGDGGHFVAFEETAIEEKKSQSQLVEGAWR